MPLPWHVLKQTEMRLLSQRATGTWSQDTVAELQSLIEKCATSHDASEAICYHGAISLICEFDGSVADAIHHRKLEIAKIERLHDLARAHPGDRAALSHYGVDELRHRRQILSELLVCNTES